MEMELQHQTLEGFRTVFDSNVMQEETLESIVPDSFPDIARIVSVSGKVFLKDKEAGAGTLRLTGSACVSVLYIPEGEEVPRALEVSIPFQCIKDCPQLYEGCVVHGAAWASSADARVINPRKMLVRVGLALQIAVYGRESREVPCDVAGCDEEPLEKQFSKCRDFMIAEVAEKPFLFSDVLRQPATKPQMDELLCCRAELGAMDAKFIGKKLVFKGDIQLSVLYRSENAVLPARFELPFSQIMDLEGTFEDAEPELTLALRSADCRLRDGEMEVTVEALAQAVLWTQRSFTLMSDVYCTAWPLEAERAPCAMCAMAEQGGRRETARQFCEAGIPAKQVLDCCAMPGEVTSQTGDGGTAYTVQFNVSVLYLSEEDTLCSAVFPIPVTCEIGVKPDCACRCRCRPIGEALAVPVTGGLEVRFEVEFLWTATREEQVQCVSALRQGPAASEDAVRPSVIIRMVGNGESLWDIAKACGSTVRDICGANDLAGEDVPKGTLLLIPTRRT